MTGKTRTSLRSFAAAFAIAGCVLGLAGACLLIEYNLQKTAAGRVDFGIGYSTSDGDVRLTDENGDPITLLTSDQQTVARLIPPPAVRLTARILQAETQAAYAAWDWLTEQGFFAENKS